jgi:hypothetical protein
MLQKVFIKIVQISIVENKRCFTEFTLNKNETLRFAQGDNCEGFSMTGWTFVILSGEKNLVLKNIQ